MCKQMKNATHKSNIFHHIIYYRINFCHSSKQNYTNEDVKTILFIAITALAFLKYLPEFDFHKLIKSAIRSQGPGEGECRWETKEVCNNKYYGAQSNNWGEGDLGKLSLEGNQNEIH